MKPDPQGLRKEHPEINPTEDHFNEVFLYCTVLWQEDVLLRDISLLGSSLKFFVGFFFQGWKK